MTRMSERIAALSPEKRVLLERRLQEKARAMNAAAPIGRRRGENTRAPLSFAQQRLWFLERLDPGNAFYNLPFASRLTGPLRLSKLEAALSEVVRRHEVLRTRFVLAGSEPVQVISSAATLPLEVTDISDGPAEARDEDIRRLVMQEAHRPFDLATGPLLRAGLIRLAESDHVLLLTMHHIISDGWSIGVLYRELTAIYSAFCANQPSPLPELPFQYADFAVWQREHLRGDVLDRLVAYWRKKLEGMPPVLELPTDRPRPPVQVFQGATYSVVVPASVLDGIKRVMRQADATLFAALTAAFDVLLSHYSGTTDIVIGTPVANRTRVELEGLIGFFVNTLVLRTDLSGDPTFLDVLSRVRDDTLEAFAHQDLPFERLVEALQPERNLSHNPLFQVMFALQNTEGAGAGPSDKTPQRSLGTSKFDLTLGALETTDGLMLVFEYNRHLFDASTIVGMSEAFELLLRNVVADPARRLSTCLASPETRTKYVARAAANLAKVRHRLAHELLEARAATHPDALAALWLHDEWSYGALNAEANRLARVLRANGVGPEVRVGLYGSPSIQMLMAIFGVLKAGGTYVPLDPIFPEERLRHLLANAEVSILLHAPGAEKRGDDAITGARLGDAVPRVLSLDDPSIAAADSSDLQVDVHPDNAAYIIYTSGSTGQPKGIAVTHRGLCNVVEAAQRVFGIEEQSRVLHGASLAFDASIFEIVVGLGVGGALCIASRDVMRSGADLAAMLRDEKVEAALLTPTSLASLPGIALPRLRTLIAGGEECGPELIARWASGRRFFNAYGPTEITIWATTAACTDATARPAIGKAIPNANVYVLDERFEPVLDGVPGEIYVGGLGVARGYVGRPDLTASQYLPDPFAREPGGRMYRTGDRGRVASNGEIQFLGRIDGQVKVRGLRIELGEIEHTLRAHPGVREAAVLVHKTAVGERRIIAYYATPQAAAIDPADLRAFLRQRLPEYMVPAAFMQVDGLPRNASGKLDRSALPAPLVGGASAEPVAPRDATEAALAHIFCEVLEISRASVTDSFFDLGGHSLLATRALARINESFRIELPLRQIFERPTIAELARVVDAAHEDGSTARPAAISRVAREAVSIPLADPE